jgi:hypothetical protein
MPVWPATSRVRIGASGGFGTGGELSSRFSYPVCAKIRPVGDQPPPRNTNPALAEMHTSPTPGSFADSLLVGAPMQAIEPSVVCSMVKNLPSFSNVVCLDPHACRLAPFGWPGFLELPARIGLGQDLPESFPCAEFAGPRQERQHGYEQEHVALHLHQSIPARRSFTSCAAASAGRASGPSVTWSSPRIAA